MPKTRTEILIETSETFTIKRKRVFVRGWCVQCMREVNMVSPAEAANISGFSQESIYTLIENRSVHIGRMKTEFPSVCLRSLCQI